MIALLIIAAVCSHEPWKDMHERGQWSHTIAITSNNNLWLLSKHRMARGNYLKGKPVRL